MYKNKFNSYMIILCLALVHLYLHQNYSSRKNISISSLLKISDLVYSSSLEWYQKFLRKNIFPQKNLYVANSIFYWMIYCVHEVVNSIFCGMICWVGWREIPWAVDTVVGNACVKMTWLDPEVEVGANLAIIKFWLVPGIEEGVDAATIVAPVEELMMVGRVIVFCELGVVNWFVGVATTWTGVIGGDRGDESCALKFDGGLILFCFCLRLQNHTRTTSFSIFSWSATPVISSEEGLGFCWKLFSRATRILVSILVLFFLLLATDSGDRLLPLPPGLPPTGVFKLAHIVSASLSHFCKSGFNLHIFLKLRFKASNLDMVVWLKSFP